MTLRVAITRAQPDADATAARIRERGHEAIVAPLLTIVPCGYDTNVDSAQALIFTSSNGVRAFPAVGEARAKLVLAVGDATAEAARSAGFELVTSAGGDARALAELAKATLDPSAGKLVHIGGEHLAGDLSGQLAAAGFVVDRLTAYAALAAIELPPALRAPFDIVLFHSARAAEAFLALGAPNSERLTAACLSPNIAEAVARARWRRLAVAPRPTEVDLLDAALEG